MEEDEGFISDSDDFEPLDDEELGEAQDHVADEEGYVEFPEFSANVEDAMKGLSDQEEAEFRLFVHQRLDFAVEAKAIYEIFQDPEQDQDFVIQLQEARKRVIAHAAQQEDFNTRVAIFSRWRVATGMLIEGKFESAIDAFMPLSMEMAILHGLDFANLSRVEQNKISPDDIPMPFVLSTKVTKALQKNCASYCNMDDAQFWKNFSIGLNKIGASSLDAVVILNLCVPVFINNHQMFKWLQIDRDNMVKDYLKILTDGDRKTCLSVFFKKLAAQRYNGAALPRNIAAEMARDAFTLYWDGRSR